jgi:hypothetical protein
LKEEIQSLERNLLRKDKALAEAALQRIRPKVHVFGHIHEGYGVLKQNGTTFINASVCDERYRPFNAPIVIDL